MTPLRQRMLEDMQLRGLSARTQECDVAAVRQLAEHYHRSPTQITEEDLRQYFLYLANEKKVARATATIALCGIRFFFEHTLHRDWTTLRFVRPARAQRLPVVLSRDEVRRILAAVRIPVYRMCLTTIYACGLRLLEGAQVQVGQAVGPQVADTDFNPILPKATFANGQGPRVLLDEAHFNFHTVDGRYAPFVKVVRSDGFVVEPVRNRFSPGALASAKILVIANATAARNKDGDWTLPTPSAFERDEIDAVRQWVADGGSLFLIADHMPFGGAAADLASAFGILLTNGYATDRTCGADEFLFQRSDGSLGDHPITRGRNAGERISSVRTFTGQAFRVISPVGPLLLLAPETVLLFPSEAWKFSDATPRVAADGMLQGAALAFGRGRVAVFGEAAMFSAQVSGPQRRPMGMNMPTAAQNSQFLLNVMHWLAGLLPEH